MPTKTLAEQASEYEEKRAALERRIDHSKRTIGETWVCLKIVDGVVMVVMGGKDAVPVSMPAMDFIRMISWFEKHYGPFDPAVEPDEEAMAGCMEWVLDSMEYDRADDWKGAATAAYSAAEAMLAEKNRRAGQ